MKNRVKNFFPSLPIFLTSLSFFAVTVATAQIPSSGLVGYWNFSGNVNDASSNGNNGIMQPGNNGSINFVTDRFGNSNSAIEFTSNPTFSSLGPYIEIPNSQNLLVNSDFTMSYSIKVSAQNVIGEIINKGADAIANSYFSRVANGILQNSIPTSGIINVSNFPIGSWQTVTITYSNSLLSYYLNGVFQQSVASGPIQSSSSKYYFGSMVSGSSNGSYYPFQGIMDDISIYNRALTPAEITQVYTSQTSTVQPPCPTLATNLQTGLVGYWPFCGNANDESGNGNNGTVNGATLTTDRFGNTNSAYSFDGLDDCIDIGTSSSLDFGSSQILTVNYWVQASNGADYRTVISRYYQGVANNSSYGLNYGGDNIGVYGNGTVAWMVINSPTGVNWNEITIVMNKSAGTAQIYKNGIFVTSGNVNYNSGISSVITSIGRMYAGSPGSPNSNHFNGKIDDISIYNRALTPSEITQLYTDPSTTPPVACTPFLGEDQTVCAGTSVTLNASVYSDSLMNNEFISLGYFNGKYYYANENLYTFNQVQSIIQQNGLSLVEINSNAENNFICSNSNYNLNGDYYISGENLIGTDVSVNGNLLTYVPWAPSEPNNYAGIETSVILNGCYWYDVLSSTSRGFIVESSYPLENQVLWSTGATTPTINVSPNSTTTYTCTVTTNGVSCTDSVTVAVNNPVIDLGADVTVCGTSTTLTAPSGYDSYSWSNGGTTNTTTVSANGTYSCTVTQGGCSATDAVDVTLVNATISAIGSVLCANQSTTLSVNAIPSATYNPALFPNQVEFNGHFYSKYTGTANWFDAKSISESNGGYLAIPNSSLESDFIENLSGIDGTSYLFTWMGMSDQISEGTWIDVLGNLVSFFYWAPGEPNNSNNEDFGLIYSNNNSPGTWNDGHHIQTLPFVMERNSIPLSILWSTGATTPTINVSPTSTTTYTCTVTTNGVSCTDSVTVVVSQPLASISPNGIVEICQGQSIALTANGGVSYLWNTGAPTQSITVNTEAVYTVTVTDANGCTDTESQLVKVNFLPNIGVNSASICPGQSTTLTATGGLSYVWSPATGLSSTTGTTVTASPSTSTVYTVTGTGANGCTNTATAAVAVNAAPTATITPATATTFCQGGSVVLNANTGVGLTYQWRLNGNTISGATSSSYTANASGSYTVVVTNTSTCSSTSAATTVTVNALPTAIITPATATTFCQGGSVVLNANTGTGLSYQWRLNGTNITGATSSSYTANASGSYTVVVTNTSTCSATSTATVVTVNALPTATITASSATTFCQGGSVVLTANTGTGLSYQWGLNGTNITGATTSSYTANANGSYTVVVTNTSTCSATSTATVVTVNALPTATITPATATTFCQGGSVVLNANTGAGLSYQWKLNGTNITGATSSSYTANASGSYTVVVTNTSACSATSSATVVTVNALPTATITASSATTFCQGGSVVLNANTGTGLTYQWRLNGTNITGATTSTYTANASGSYTVVVTNTSTCSSTSTATVVTVNALPTATITPATATTFCQGGSVVLNANTGAGLSYQWRLNGTNITGATTSSYTANASGSYTVVVTNTSTCSATSTATVVTVNALPTATITPATATTFCQGGSVVLNANTGAGLTYQWRLNGTNITGATTSSYTANASGSYTVVVTNTSTCSATSTATVVTVNALPTATITPATATTFCQGGSVVLNANTGTGLTYQWRLNGTNINGATSASYTANASGSYTVVVTNTSTCSATSTATVVTVNALPTATITASSATTFCQGGSVVLTANTGTGLSYQWGLNGTNITGATTSTYTANANGSYTVVVTNTSTCSATSTATVVTVNALPTATITPATATTFCQGGSVVLNANTGAGLSYQWFNNAVAISGATSASYTANASGSYTVVVTNTSTCSATSSATIVTVNALPTSTITASSATTFCQGGSVVLTANTGAGLSYQWFNNAVAISGATSASYTANASGSYTVVVTNTSTCSATSSATIVTVNALPTSTITASSATTFCQGGSVVLTANTGAGLSYQWFNNAVAISGATSASYTANASGSYTVVVTNTSTCAATSTATVVTVNALPIASISPNGLVEICEGQSIALTANGGVSYLWSTGAPTQSITVNTEALYTVTVTDINGCTDTESQFVKVNQLPNIAVNNASICAGQSATLTATGGLSYVWSPATGLSATTGSTVSSSTTTNAAYTVTGTGANGCTNSATATVTVNPLPTSTITAATTTTFCQGGSVVLNANNGAGLTYQWFNNGLAISGAISASYTATTSGSFTVTVTNASTCSATSIAIDVTTIPNIDYYADTDGDGYGDVTTLLSTCVQPQGYVTNSSDCNDNNAAIFPGAQEICNDIDDDCNELIDDGLVFITYYADVDGDSFGDINNPLDACMMPDGYVTNNTDCNDNNANQSAASTEICNGEDDDCDGAIDNGLIFLDYYADLDSDGFGAGAATNSCVDLGAGYVTNNTDCNDNNANQNTASTEICNGEDDDCDGAIDNGITFLDYYADADGDGFGAGDVISSCSDLGAGYVSNNTDCDDSNGNTYPGATELCNTIDDNCDGQIDEGVQTVYFIDNDGDTYGNPSVSILACTQPIGYTPDDNDCNDTDANINPGAEDIGGNGIDENCDGEIDNSIFELNATISLYPNPTRSELNIQVNSSIIGNDLYIFDAVGKLVFKQQLLSTQTTVPVSNFADGNYVLRVGEVVKRFEVMK